MTPRYTPAQSMKSICRASHNMIRLGSHIRVAALATPDGRAAWKDITTVSDKRSALFVRASCAA